MIARQDVNEGEQAVAALYERYYTTAGSPSLPAEDALELFIDSAWFTLGPLEEVLVELEVYERAVFPICMSPQR